MKAGQTKARNKNLLREEREARPRFEMIPATIYLKKLPIATSRVSSLRKHSTNTAILKKK